MNAKGGAAYASFRTDLQPKNLLITFDALTAQLMVTIAKNLRNCELHLKRRTLCTPGLLMGARESGEFPRRKARFCAQRIHVLGKRNYCAFFQKILDQCAIVVIKSNRTYSKSV